MISKICLFISILFYIVFIIIGIFVKRSTKKKYIPLINILIIPTLLSAILLFVPIYLNNYNGETGAIFKTFFISIQNALQVFSLDGDYDILKNNIQLNNSLLTNFYLIFAAFLYGTAPILTIGVVLSFFKSIFSHIRLYLGGFKKLFVFSELNHKSITLAQSCLKKNPKRSLVLFTDVFEEDKEKSYELVHKAQCINAICLKSDVTSIKFNFLLKRKKIIFFIIGNDEAENINQSLSLINSYKDNKNASLYSFIISTEGSLLLSSVVDTNTQMKVRRINEVQTLVYNYLYYNNLFKNAIAIDAGNKLLSVIIIGMGQYGTELLKAILWYGQIPGYKLIINVFDIDYSCEERFCSECPEIMEMNNNLIDGEAHYSIIFHRREQYKGIDVKTKTFDDAIIGMKYASVAFVALGNDSLNLETAIKLRRIFKKHYKFCDPLIETVIYTPDRANVVKTHSLKDFKGNNFDIGFIGDLKSVCSYDVIVNSDIEEEAMERHIKWVDKNDLEAVRNETINFYKYEYYYRSSIASVIRNKIRKEVLNIDNENVYSERSEDKKIIIRKAEHMAWNAYMRSEGYCYAEKRDDLAKTHCDLVAFDKLSINEQLKDDD